MSSRGFAYGYIGGGSLLLVHLAVLTLTQDTEYADLATRATLLSVGVWWFGWALWTLRAVPEPPIHSRVHGLNALTAVRLAVSEMRTTFAHLSRLRVTLRYLGSYLLFNDGVQTVTAIAGAFAADYAGHPPSLQHDNDSDDTVRRRARRHAVQPYRRLGLQPSSRLRCPCWAG